MKRKLYKSSRKYVLLLILSSMLADFGSEENWPENLWQGLKVESIVKI